MSRDAVIDEDIRTVHRLMRCGNLYEDADSYKAQAYTNKNRVQLFNFIGEIHLKTNHVVSLRKTETLEECGQPMALSFRNTNIINSACFDS